MEQLDWIIIVSVSISFILFVFAMLSFVQKRLTAKKIKELGQEKLKRRSEKKKARREKRALEKRKSVLLKRSLIFIVLFGLFGGIGGYAKFYQATNLASNDADNLTSGYYLIDQIEQQLVAINAKEPADKVKQKDIHGLAIRMAGYSAQKANDRIPKEAQALLNRYYARIGQYGVNLSAQDFNKLKSEEQVQASYTSDLENLKKIQKELLDFYKINEKSIKQ